MAVLKANRVFTQLNPPINVFLKTSANSDLFGKEIITLDKYRWLQRLRELAEMDFRGLYGSFLIICVALFLKFLQSIIVCRSGRTVFEGEEVRRTFLRFRKPLRR